MNKELKFLSTSRTRTGARGAVSITALCAGLLAAHGGLAQEVVEGGRMAQAAATPPLPTSHRPIPMQISLASVPAGAAEARRAAVSASQRGPDCVGEIRDETSVSVPVGKSVILPLDEPVRNRTLGNPVIMQATLVSPRTLYLVGMAIGTTNMIVQGRSGACKVIDVVVNVDAGGLQTALADLMPEERGIRVSTAAGNLVLAGRVSSAPAAQKAMEIARAYQNAQATQQTQASATSTGNNGATTASMTEQKSESAKSGDVINMMTVDAPQQVMLEVKVAEVDKTLMNQLGSALNLQGGFGSWAGALVSNLLAGVSSAVAVSKANNRPFQLAVDAQKTDNLVKILAEPNLLAISGQEASFLAGGKVFIPVPQSNTTGGSTITLQEEEFGVGLKFTPTVLAGGRINLKVAPEVSELSSTGVTLSAPSISGVAILPLITTRRASTTVQMNDGESFAIGGLLQDNITGALKAIPGIGELPVIGALARSTSFQQEKTELVFIITPHLVKPLPGSSYPLPTDSFTQPADADIYATGDMEGRGGEHALKGTTPAHASNMPAPRTPDPAAPSPQTPAAPVPPAPAMSQPVPTPVSVDDSHGPAPAPRDTEAKRPAPISVRTPDEGATAQTQAASIEAKAARIAAGQDPSTVAAAGKVNPDAR